MAWITNSVSTRSSQMTSSRLLGGVGADDEDLRWVGVRLQVHDDDRVLDGVKDGLLVDAVLER